MKRPTNRKRRLSRKFSGPVELNPIFKQMPYGGLLEKYDELNRTSLIFCVAQKLFVNNDSLRGGGFEIAYAEPNEKFNADNGEDEIKPFKKKFGKMIRSPDLFRYDERSDFDVRANERNRAKMDAGKTKPRGQNYKRDNVRLTEFLKEFVRQLDLANETKFSGPQTKLDIPKHRLTILTEIINWRINLDLKLVVRTNRKFIKNEDVRKLLGRAYNFRKRTIPKP